MRKKISVLFVALGVFVFVFIFFRLSNADKKRKDDLYRQVELFSDTLAIIQSDYVDEAKPKDLIYGALKGMLSSLDPHSQFMDPDAYNELKVDTQGKFGGLGIEITIDEGMLTVITPIEDTPAWKAGIKPMDRIVKINNEITRDMTLTDSVKRMRGKPKEAVNLTILRESVNKILEFRIVRDIIKIKDIKHALILEDGIGYIRLTEFREDTSKNLDNALSNLSKDKMSALVLDLRNNPGGLLEAAVEVTSKFIPAGQLIVYTKGRKENQNFELFSKSNEALTQVPMVVLINEGSASGSEIVAGALQDYKRAIVVGVKSFGKGSVQTVIPLGDGSALKLTTSRYFTTKGKEIHGKGVMPDIIVEEKEVKLDTSLVEKPIQKQSVFEEVDGKVKSLVPPGNFDYKEDIQIMRAVDLLKALKFYKDDK
jgi:carboxyl-terminal processing protease